MKTALLKTCDSAIDAHIIRTKLEDAGIWVALFNENFTNLMPHFYKILGSGVQIRVLESDLEAARTLIEMVKDTSKCPHCNSSDIKMDMPWKKRVTALFVAIFSAGLIGNLLTTFTCSDCKKTFKP